MDKDSILSNFSDIIKMDDIEKAFTLFVDKNGNVQRVGYNFPPIELIGYLNWVSNDVFLQTMNKSEKPHIKTVVVEAPEALLDK